MLDGDEALAALFRRRADGPVKLRLLSALLHDRRERSGFYAHADYRPVDASGAKREKVIAFARRFADEALLVVVPRLAGSGAERAVMPLGRDYWGDTGVEVPADLGGEWHDVLGGPTHRLGGTAACGDLLAALPVAVLRRRL